MAKITRRNFLKGLATIGAISPFFNIDAIKANLANFTDEQLEALKEVDSIKEADAAPYVACGDRLYAVRLKDGNTVYLWRDDIIERYGSILNLLQVEDNVESMRPIACPPAIWND